MPKLVIIYDSKTGNTEIMAKNIAEGAKSVSGVDVIIKKIGEAFSVRMLLDDADAIILGSPAHYAYVTPEMRDFLACLRGQLEYGDLVLKGKLGAAFGSYGWDGGKSIERLGIEMEELGIKIQSPVIAQTPLLPHPSLRESSLKECRDLGKNIADKISKSL